MEVSLANPHSYPLNEITHSVLLMSTLAIVDFTLYTKYHPRTWYTLQKQPSLMENSLEIRLNAGQPERPDAY